MYFHIKQYSRVDSDLKKAYHNSSLSFKPIPHSSRNVIVSNQTNSYSIRNFFAHILRPGQLQLVHDKSVRFALSAKSSYAALGNQYFKKLIYILNVSENLPTLKSFNTTVLDRLVRK